MKAIYVSLVCSITSFGTHLMLVLVGLSVLFGDISRAISDWESNVNPAAAETRTASALAVSMLTVLEVQEIFILAAVARVWVGPGPSGVQYLVKFTFNMLLTPSITTM